MICDFCTIVIEELVKRAECVANHEEEKHVPHQSSLIQEVLFEM